MIRPQQTSYLLGFWLVAALAQLAGDVTLYLALRRVQRPISWLDIRATRPVPDSLWPATSRYLRDSLGIRTGRAGDTLVLRVPPAAEQAVEATVESVRVAGRRVTPWLLAAVVLLHVPLLLAVLATARAILDRGRRESNRALDVWDNR